MHELDLSAALQALSAGGIIAYPTEAVYGLGCAAWNAQAVERLLYLKQRPVEKGLILLAANVAQIADLLAGLTPDQKQRVLATWPGPVTWLLPVTARIPVWISGGNSRVAVRVSAHPIAHRLALEFGEPIVSTSANRADEAPILTAANVKAVFGAELDYVLEGPLGGLDKPTEIRDALTGLVVRAGV